jgi:ketosteroid isomerase-like protein
MDRTVNSLDQVRGSANEGGLDRAVERYHRALTEFIKGNPEPNQEVFSHRADVSLANPLGPVALGWEQVVATMNRAAALLRDGEDLTVETLVRSVTSELAFIVHVERCRARVGGGQEIVPIALRVTTIFRPEDGTWKVVHRHADPITSARPPESIVQQ